MRWLSHSKLGRGLLVILILLIATAIYAWPTSRGELPSPYTDSNAFFCSPVDMVGGSPGQLGDSQASPRVYKSGAQRFS
jgi:hypothetical protein